MADIELRRNEFVHHRRMRQLEIIEQYLDVLAAEDFVRVATDGFRKMRDHHGRRVHHGITRSFSSFAFYISDPCCRQLEHRFNRGNTFERHLAVSGVHRQPITGHQVALRDDLAFEQQKKLDDKSPLKLATELKLDEVKFKTCLEDPKTAEALKTAEEEARFLGVTGTPNFFVDGKPFQPHVEMEKELVVAIDTALAAKTGSSTSSTAPVAAPTTPAAPAAN